MAYAASVASTKDRAKALIGVAAVHAALGLAFLSGLTVTMARQAADHLATFDVREVPPPPPVSPPPKQRPRPAKKAQGAPPPKTEPTPIVAPPPKLAVPSPIPAARIAGTGSASTSGAALAGRGTGASGSGNGTGDGGYGGFTPARQITTIPNREYRRLAASGVVNGSVGITLLVNPDGSPTNCRIARSSGNPYADATMCQLATYYVRFRPALDASGRPVAEDITWYPRWWRP